MALCPWRTNAEVMGLQTQVGKTWGEDRGSRAPRPGWPGARFSGSAVLRRLKEVACLGADASYPGAALNLWGLVNRDQSEGGGGER